MTLLLRRSVNLDITNRCTLLCPKCARQDTDIFKQGADMSDSAFDKILDHFDRIVFCGQYADPVFHPNFHNFLEKCYNAGKETVVYNAASQRPLKWYYDAFNSNPKAEWIFGIDGLPKDSNKYRINQNGEKLFDVMSKATDYLDKVTWSYIVFKYNQNDVDTCRQLADNVGVNFSLCYSTRWTDNDPLKPTGAYYDV